MENENIFRSSALGFNKADVTSYLSGLKAKEAKLLSEVADLKKELEKQPILQKKQYDDRIFGLQNELDSCCGKIIERENEILLLKKELSESNLKLTELQRTSDMIIRNQEKVRTEFDEKSALINELNEKNNILSEKNNELLTLNNDLVARNAELITQKNEKELNTDEMAAKIDELTAKNESHERACELLQNNLNATQSMVLEKNAEIEELNSQLKQFELQAEDFSSQVEAYEQKVEAMHAASEKLHLLEKQLGSSIVDARRYSERIVNDAKAASTKISTEVYISVNQTSNKINRLSEELDNFTFKFSDTLKQLKGRLDRLTKNLDDVALELVNNTEETNSEAQTPALQANVQNTYNEY